MGPHGCSLPCVCSPCRFLRASALGALLGGGRYGAPWRRPLWRSLEAAVMASLEAAVMASLEAAVMASLEAAVMALVRPPAGTAPVRVLV